MNKRRGDWVKERRLARGMTQKELAYIVWCSPGYISQLENGCRNRLALRFVVRLADALAYDDDDRRAFLDMLGRGEHFHPNLKPGIAEYMQQFPLAA